MQVQLPPDLATLVHRRMESGAFSSVEEVLREALQAQDEEESWSEEERKALDEKLDRALAQVAAGQTYTPEEGLAKLAALRARHLAGRD